MTNTTSRHRACCTTQLPLQPQALRLQPGRLARPPYRAPKRSPRPVDPERLRRPRREPERLSAPRPLRHPRWQAGPPRPQQEPHPHHRLQDRPGTALAQVPGHDLHVRPTAGHARVLRLQVRRRDRLQQPHRARSPRRHRPGLCAKPRLTDPPHRGSGAPSPRSQRPGVPFLRHHGRRLPGPEWTKPRSQKPE